MQHAVFRVVVGCAARATLLSNGKLPRDAAASLNKDLAGLTAYCDCWAHGYAWLAVLFEATGLSPRFRLESVNRLLSEPQLALLDEARRTSLAEMGLTRHRASNDARALQRALLRLGVSATAEARPSPVRVPATDAT